jgi:hypothetical protein
MMLYVTGEAGIRKIITRKEFMFPESWCLFELALRLIIECHLRYIEKLFNHRKPAFL